MGTGKFHERRATPVVDTSAYADEDHVGDLMTFTDAFGSTKNEGAVISVTLIMETGALGTNGLSLLLFNASTAIASADNAALNVTDALMTANAVGFINIPNTAETILMGLSASTIACVNGLKLPCKSTDGNLYGILQAHAAITFTATNDLTVILGTESD